MAKAAASIKGAGQGSSDTALSSALRQSGPEPACDSLGTPKAATHSGWQFETRSRSWPLSMRLFESMAHRATAIE